MGVAPSAAEMIADTNAAGTKLADVEEIVIVVGDELIINVREESEFDGSEEITVVVAELIIDMEGESELESTEELAADVGAKLTTDTGGVTELDDSEPMAVVFGAELTIDIGRGTELRAREETAIIVGVGSGELPEGVLPGLGDTVTGVVVDIEQGRGACSCPSAISLTGDPRAKDGVAIAVVCPSVFPPTPVDTMPRKVGSDEVSMTITSAAFILIALKNVSMLKDPSDTVDRNEDIVVISYSSSSMFVGEGEGVITEAIGVESEAPRDKISLMFLDTKVGFITGATRG